MENNSTKLYGEINSLIEKRLKSKIVNVTLAITDSILHSEVRLHGVSCSLPTPVSTGELPVSRLSLEKRPTRRSLHAKGVRTL